MIYNQKNALKKYTKIFILSALIYIIISSLLFFTIQNEIKKSLFNTKNYNITYHSTSWSDWPFGIKLSIFQPQIHYSNHSLSIDYLSNTVEIGGNWFDWINTLIHTNTIPFFIPDNALVHLQDNKNNTTFLFHKTHGFLSHNNTHAHIFLLTLHAKNTTLTSSSLTHFLEMSEPNGTLYFDPSPPFNGSLLAANITAAETTYNSSYGLLHPISHLHLIGAFIPTSSTSSQTLIRLHELSGFITPQTSTLPLPPFYISLGGEVTYPQISGEIHVKITNWKNLIISSVDYYSRQIAIPPAARSILQTTLHTPHIERIATQPLNISFTVANGRPFILAPPEISRLYTTLTQPNLKP